MREKPLLGQAAAFKRVREVRRGSMSAFYWDNFISGRQRPWVAKDVSWTVKKQDMLKFEDFSKT